MTPQGIGPLGRAGSKIPQGYKQFQLQNFTPEQMDQLSNLFGFVKPDSQLGRLAQGDQSSFQEMEAPAMRQFSGLQGNIGSRFAGMGQGGLRSSGFKNTMNQAASDFAQDLQSKRMQTRMDSLRELMNFSNMLLGQRPFETGLAEKQQQPGFFQTLASGLGGAIPGAISGFMTGGPAGAAIGGGMGAIGGASNAFQRQSRPMNTPYVPGSGNFGFQGLGGY